MRILGYIFIVLIHHNQNFVFVFLDVFICVACRPTDVFVGMWSIHSQLLVRPHMKSEGPLVLNGNGTSYVSRIKASSPLDGGFCLGSNLRCFFSLCPPRGVLWSVDGRHLWAGVFGGPENMIQLSGQNLTPVHRMLVTLNVGDCKGITPKSLETFRFRNYMELY